MELNQKTKFAGRFKVIGCLGTGHNGPVFLAKDALGDNAVVALKVFHEWALGPKNERTKFSTNLKALKTLECNGISKPLEYVEDNGVQALCMQHIEGRDLSSILEENPFPITQIVNLLLNLADRLHALHLMGFVHNDIKPAHIIISAEGEVTLCGCPKPIGVSGTTVKMYLGAAHYIAPEFLRSGIAEPQNDIYALGMLGSELLERAGKAQAADSKTSGKTPLRLQRIFNRALEREPADRYLNFQEFMQDLQDHDRFLSSSSFGTAFVWFFGIYNVLLLLALYFLSNSSSFRSLLGGYLANPF